MDTEAADSPPDRARPRRPASTDVARLAGVSQKTVSRVMNGEPHVKEEVRRRVLTVAAELGYRPNNAARALISGRTRRIGVVSLGTALFGPATVLVAFERAARRQGYALSLANTFGGDPGGIAGAVDQLLEQGVDGIILSEPIDVGPLKLDVHVPILVVGDYPGLTAPDVLRTSVSGHRSARVATEHLLALGHQTVHHVSGPQRWFSARDRWRGWREALERAGGQVPPPLEGDWTAPSGYQAGQVLAQDPAVTAIFAANDDMAIGVIRALTEANRSVPRDVSVVGYDDIPLSGYCNPPLTTVNQQFQSVAEAGVAALIQRIAHPDEQPPYVDEPPVRMVIRASSAPPSTTVPAEVV
ncbi:MAG: LacI family DNA-binding transcriptional regulator [Nocardioidaceae bacterium]